MFNEILVDISPSNHKKSTISITKASTSTSGNQPATISEGWRGRLREQGIRFHLGPWSPGGWSTENLKIKPQLNLGLSLGYPHILHGQEWPKSVLFLDARRAGMVPSWTCKYNGNDKWATVYSWVCCQWYLLKVPFWRGFCWRCYHPNLISHAFMITKKSILTRFLHVLPSGKLT